MHRRSALAVALPAALAAAAIAIPIGFGSSHREAPLTALDPTADDTDVYAFTAQDAPGTLTIVANWIPLEDPAGGPNFFRFDDRAHYYMNIDNTGDGKADIRYEFRFKTHYRNPNTFLYALPTVDSIDSPNLNIYQTYSITKEQLRNGHTVSENKIAKGLRVAPDNVGPHTIPDYNAVANEAISTLKGGGKVFAGQRDDPFFVDLGATFDALTIRNGTGNAGGGKDDLAGYAIHTIVLQVPDHAVTRDHKSVSGPKAGNAVVGVWSDTERNKVRVIRKNGQTRVTHPEVQVSRLGNPLINEVVIPLGQKDHFNATKPDTDAQLYGQYALNPELAHLINVLYPGVNAPEHNRTDIVTALLTGIPGLTQIGKHPVPADTLKINLGVPPNPHPNRFGLLAGDTQGFPNGRRLTDDVVDIEERVVAGFLQGNKVPLGDGVDQNDKPFSSTFPYLVAPNSGFDSELKRIEPTHDPDPAQP
jgi:hypothetical protein